MYRAPHKCCICGETLTVSRLSCSHCGTVMEGAFEGCPFCSLSEEETRFLLTFLKNRGSIKDVERDMGISYPTVRGLLDNLLATLNLNDTVPAEVPRETAESEPVRKRRAGARDTAAARSEILRLLSEHKITADEAARRLKDL